MKKKSFIKNPCITITYWVCILVGASFTIGFLHGRDLFCCDGSVLDAEVVGQYGDFIGGAIGTILSVVLLYHTFQLQRKNSDDNVLVYKQQQLTDLFFHHLKQYDEILKTIKLQTDEGEDLQGRVALHFRLEELQKQFVPYDRENVNRKKARSLFLDFYSLSRDFLPIYFRSLYRAFKLLEKPEKGLDEKSIQLMKMLRAQLSDSELVLLRYNGMTRQGTNFVPLINKFNLLKHLPPLELMEYKGWSQKMLLEERGRTNVLLLVTKRNIHRVLEKGSLVESYSENPTRYNINVSTNKGRTELGLCLFINKNVLLSGMELINGICKLADEEKLALLTFFVKDCLVMSSFNKLNEYKDLKFDSGMNQDGKFWVKVRSKNLKALRMNGETQYIQ